MHVLVVIAYCQERCFALPPIYRACGTAWNGESVATAISNLLTAFNVDYCKIRHVVVDGAKYNHTSLEVLNALGELHAASQVLEVLEETSCPVTVTPDWLRVVQTVIREKLFL